MDTKYRQIFSGVFNKNEESMSGTEAKYTVTVYTVHQLSIYLLCKQNISSLTLASSVTIWICNPRSY